jgi:hypothetical protein
VLSITNLIALAQATKEIVAAARAGKVQVTSETGAVLPVEEVNARFATAFATQDEVSSDVAERFDARHPGQ